MKRSAVLLVLIFLVFGIGSASAIEYSINNGSSDISVNPLSGAMSAADYYDYDNFASGFPPFGTEANTAFTWLWEDTTTNEISLGIIFNTPDNWPKEVGVHVYADITFSGVPNSAYWSVKDDNEAYPYLLSLARWEWGKRTDGGVISGLNGTWEIIMGLYTEPDARPLGVDQWYFLSDGAGKYDNPIDISNGLTIRAYNPVPEPATMLLLGTGLIGLAGFRRKKF